METNNQVRCPKCNSTQLTANKKGFSGGKAAAGVILTGGIGLLAGTIGSKKVIITCLNCGKQFKPGEGSKPEGLQPKLIWDETLKKHVVNPNYKGNVQTASLPVVSVIFIFVIIVLYFLLK